MSNAATMCPFTQKKCNDKCVLYRKGFRYNEVTETKPIPFESCAINIAADCLENLVTRSIPLQQEMNKVRNGTDKVAEIFETIVNNSINNNSQKRLE
jgi:hypothetical protein